MATVSNHDLDEVRRLAALHALSLLDSKPEREFDSLVALASELLGCPTAMLTLIDRDRQWIKARTGSGFVETSRSIAFCDHTVRELGALVVENAAEDPRFRDNPLVTGPDRMRFYAGVPIHAVDREGKRQPIGALCVSDTRPRTISPSGEGALAHLATLAEAVIAARDTAQRAIEIATRSEHQAAELARRDRVFRQAERLAGIGSWRYDLADDWLDWSDGVFRLHGLSNEEQPSIEQALDYYGPDARARISARLADIIENGTSFDIEEEFCTAQGEPRRMRALAERELVDGRPLAIVGVFQDITDQYRMEQALRHSAATDPLTGLANRTAFDGALAAAIVDAHATKTPLALAMIDLDGFKVINDTLGHAAGDEVLRQIGRMLKQPWLLGMHAARLGGDEFALIIGDAAIAADPGAWRAALQEALHVSVSASGITMVSAGSVGIARLEPHDDTRDFVHRADMELYAAKRARIGVSEHRRARRRSVG